jgi:NADPH:quinone reductase-like Zn-dependent oxidoreductase
LNFINFNLVKVGDRVIVIPGIHHGGAIKIGTWTDYAVYNKDNLFKVPENISDEAASQAYVNPVTAYTMLDKINAPKGEYIIQSAAGSVLGRILIQFAKARGLKTINLVRRKEQIQELKAIGADKVLNTDDGSDIVAEIKKITNGKGAYGAFDAVGGDLGLKLSQSVRDNGFIFLYGFLGGFEVKVSSIELLVRNIYYTGFELPKYIREIGKERFHNVLKNVFELLGNDVEPFTGARYSLDQVSEAINQSLKPGRGGKVLLVHV